MGIILPSKVVTKMGLCLLLDVVQPVWRYVEYFWEFREEFGTRYEAFWSILRVFSEAFWKSLDCKRICRNFYLSSPKRHGRASAGETMNFFAQIVLKVFSCVFSSQKKPETYLQHAHTTKIELSKAFWKFKKSPTILTPSYGGNDSQLTPSFYSAKWPLKWLYICF